MFWAAAIVSLLLPLVTGNPARLYRIVSSAPRRDRSRCRDRAIQGGQARRGWRHSLSRYFFNDGRSRFLSLVLSYIMACVPWPRVAASFARRRRGVACP